MASPVPVIRMDEVKARQAWEVYAAMRRAEKTEPKLAENSTWGRFRDEVFEQFTRSFEAL